MVFTNQKLSTTSGVRKERKMRGRPQRKKDVTKAKKGTMNTRKEENQSRQEGTEN